MEMNEAVKAAYVDLNVKEGVSLVEIRAEYLNKTAHPKFMKILGTDENLQKEFLRYYKAYVTLLRSFDEAELNEDIHHYPANQLFQFHFNQGVYFFITQNYLKAGDKFQAAYAIDNQNSLLRIYLGVLLLKRKNYYAAEKYFKGVLETEKNNDEAWFWLGESYFKAGEFRKALNMYETSKNLNPSRKELAPRIKTIREKLGEKITPGEKKSWFTQFLNKLSGK